MTYNRLVYNLKENYLSNKDVCSEDLTTSQFNEVIQILLFKIYDGAYLSDDEIYLTEKIEEVKRNATFSTQHMPQYFLRYLRKNPHRIADNYAILLAYFKYITNSFFVLTEDECALLPYFPELSEKQKARHPHIAQFIEIATITPEHLTDAQKHLVCTWLNAKIFDHFPLEEQEKKACIRLNISMESSLPSIEEAIKEYGYDPYDFNEVIERITQHEIAPSEYAINSPLPSDFKEPISQRERSFLRHIWKFDPASEEAISLLTSPLHQDLLNTAEAEKYIQSMQRYR